MPFTWTLPHLEWIFTLSLKRPKTSYLPAITPPTIFIIFKIYFN